MTATKKAVYPTFSKIATSGMPVNFVNSFTPKVPVTFYYEADQGTYPITATSIIQPAADHHALFLDTSSCILYEIYNLKKVATGWRAASGAIYNLRSNALRTAGWTSADAAGLPILPGAVRYDEVASGHINHALRVTVDHTRNQYIWPARHAASKLTGAQYPPMGQRLRLKASYDISSFSAPVKVILQALKTYGFIVADNGPSWDLTGIPDPRWDSNVLYAITKVTGTNFEAVDESKLMIDPSSGEARSSTVPTGWVNIVSMNSGKCAHITGGPAATWQTAILEQWTCLGAEETNQIFQFVPVGTGFEIKVRNSGLALQVTGGTSSIQGSFLEQWPFEGKSYQVWSVTPIGGGYYTISPRSQQDFCVDVQSGSKINSAKIQQWECSGNENQKWRFVPIQ